MRHRANLWQGADLLAAAQRVITIEDRAEGRTAAGRLVDDIDLRPSG
jgi:hypothetical protein